MKLFTYPSEIAVFTSLSNDDVVKNASTASLFTPRIGSFLLSHLDIQHLMSLSFLFTSTSFWQEKNRIDSATTKFFIFIITAFIPFYLFV